jgi:UDP-N-acetylmuramoylalanine--D-glutamate ligase
MGLGLFGGGVSVARYLVRRGARVVVTDLRDRETLRESVEALSDLPVALHLGGHAESDFEGADVVVANPAVRPDSPYLERARRGGARVTSEFEIAILSCPAPIVAVTGTNGKSTTTSLAGEMLRRAGFRTWVGGNIGRSLLDVLEEIRLEDRVVLEVSSYQLETLEAPEGFPRVAVVTNLTQDHLDRHRTMEAYGAAKARILLRQGPGDAAVLNAEDPIVWEWRGRARGRVLGFGPIGRGEAGVAVERDRLAWRDGNREVLLARTDEVRLREPFNLSNAAAAAAAALDLGASPEAVASAMREFEPLPHRLQLLGVWEGIRIVDNAVSTVPESTVSAIRALDPPILLVAGGRSKALSLDPLVDAIVEGGVRAVFAYGESAETLARALRDRRGAAAVSTFGPLADAVRAALKAARRGDALLYSPAFSSFDAYRNFLERGAEFRRLVGFPAPGSPPPGIPPVLAEARE